MGENETQKQPESSELLTVKQVARYLKLDDTTIRRRIYNGMLPNVVGMPCANDPKRRIWRISRQSLADMLHVEASSLPVLSS
jgi:serine protease inhibitor ecotin